MGHKTTEFTIDFKNGAIYGCKGKITKVLKNFKADCVSMNDTKVKYRCDVSEKFDSSFGKFKMKGKECILEGFSIKKKDITDKDAGFDVEERGTFINESEFNIAVKEIKKSLESETIVEKI